MLICFHRCAIFKLKDKFLYPVTCFISLFLIMTLAGLWPSSSFAQIHFEEVSQAAGFSRWGDSFGASWGDYNSDGWPDLWVGNHVADPSLYLNNSDGTFTEVNHLIKYDTGFEQHGAAWADFDNDGDNDLIQIVGGARHKGVFGNQLFVNSEGLLENKAAAYGLDYPLGRGRTPLWFDWNSDGYLDVFISNINRTDGKEAPSALFTQQKNFFKNDTDLTIETGLSSKSAQIFIPTFRAIPSIVVNGDYGDHHYPLRVYDYSSLPFRDITDTIGLPRTDHVLDVSIADFNNDLLNDFFLATANYNTSREDRLLIQTADGFQDSSSAAGVNISTICTSVASADFDNDMDMDIYLVCSGTHCNTPNILYENLGGGTFQSVTAAGGAMGSSYGWGDSVVTADFNNDGFVDLFVTNRRDSMDYENSHSHLYRNSGNNNHWIEIELKGVVSNRNGIGALLLASTAGITQMRVQDGGIHRVSQNHQRIHFGLAENNFIEELTIQWPSGIVQKINNIHADQIITVTELDFTGSVTGGKPPFQVDFLSNTKGHYQPKSYEWDFDNDGTIDATVQNPSYLYNRLGIYTVKLIVTDMDGSIYTSIRENYIKILSAN